jgi:multidrug efflux pump subunit AcrA (membrane-fusion protein)
MKKLLVFIIVLLCFGLIGWKVYQKVSAMENQPSRPRPSAIPIPVNIEPVQKTSIREMITFTGTLYPKTQFNIAPKVGGRLESLLVNIGDVVQQGQLIAVLDDDEYVQQMDQAKAELEVAEARIEESRSALDIARRELEREKN